MRNRALLAAALSCAAVFAPAEPTASRAPYDSPPVAASTVTIALDLEAARRILALLSAPAFDLEAARALESLAGRAGHDPGFEAAARRLRARPRGGLREQDARLGLRLPEDPRGPLALGRAPHDDRRPREGADEAHVRPRARPAPGGPARVRVDRDRADVRRARTGRPHRRARRAGRRVVGRRGPVARALGRPVVAAGRADHAPLAPDGLGGLPPGVGRVQGGQPRLAAARRKPRPARAPPAPGRRGGAGRDLRRGRELLSARRVAQAIHARQPRRVEPRGRPPRLGGGRARRAHGRGGRDPEARVHRERRRASRRVPRRRDHPGARPRRVPGGAGRRARAPSSSPTARPRTRRAAG